MNTITGGELLARALANEGVKFVFGLQCPEIDPFLAALEGNGIRFVPIRHEAAAVHMAEGLYKTTGQVAVVLGNPGPGSANLIPGMVTARHEAAPARRNLPTGNLPRPQPCWRMQNRLLSSPVVVSIARGPTPL
jgi:acetolactate synthase-1/2/3 large subunit